MRKMLAILACVACMSMSSCVNVNENGCCNSADSIECIIDSNIVNDTIMQIDTTNTQLDKDSV